MGVGSELLVLFLLAPHPATRMDDIVVLSLSRNPWGAAFWVSRQFLMYELAGHFPVLYANERVYVRRLVTAECWRDRSRQKASPPFAPPAGMRLFEPGLRFPHVPGYPRLDRLFARRYCRALRRECSRYGARRTVAYAWEPRFVRYLPDLGVDRVVYHPYDRFSLFPAGDDVSRAVAAEREMVDRADAVVTPHRTIAEALGHPRTFIVHNGLFTRAFRSGPSPGPPSPLRDIPRPRIGYVGVINEKVDFELLAEIFRRRPDWSAVMLGPVRGRPERDPSGSRPLRGLKNVHFLPPVRFDRVPAQLRELDLGMMPYDCSTWAGACESPLKMYQYWASGLPAVSTPLAHLESQPGLLQLAETADEWVGAIEWELAHDSEEARRRRVELSAQHCWSGRARRVAEIIRDLF